MSQVRNSRTGVPLLPLLTRIGKAIHADEAPASIRDVAQLAVHPALVPVMLAGSLRLSEIAAAQAGLWFIAYPVIGQIAFVFVSGDARAAAPEILHVVRRVTGARAVVGCSGVGVLTEELTRLYEELMAFSAETDAVESSINLKLQQRQLKANLLSQYVSAINQADDTALDALQAARTQTTRHSPERVGPER